MVGLMVLREPLVRFRELNTILPRMADRGIYTQLVTSAVRPIPFEWAGLRRLQIVVSIDGLQPEHDERRKPATYDRILKHIEGHSISVHCTVTRQQVRREGYLEEFVKFWSANSNISQLLISLYTPQVGELSAAATLKTVWTAVGNGMIWPSAVTQGSWRQAPAVPPQSASVVQEPKRFEAELVVHRNSPLSPFTTYVPAAEDAEGDDRKLFAAAALTGRLYLRQNHGVRVVELRKTDHAMSVRRQPRLRQLRLHRLGGPRRRRPPHTTRRPACGRDLRRIISDRHDRKSASCHG